ncbi:formyltransferase family protein [Paramagnetospirillum magnetotacticum]|nr:formyltransferase family protein [Paramagnetospirillum magnetotacticum]
MLDTILLLAGEAERPVLADRLRRAEPMIRVMEIASVKDLPAELGSARLLAFLFPEIVPVAALEGLGYGAYNIHPGPPDYPGWAPVSFALYDGVTQFGATLHEMAARADSGIICDVESFAIPPDADMTRLSELVYGASLRLFERWVEGVVSPLRLPRLPIPWGERRCTRKGFAELSRIPEDASEEERLRRIRAVGAEIR